MLIDIGWPAISAAIQYYAAGRRMNDKDRIRAWAIAAFISYFVFKAMSRAVATSGVPLPRHWLLAQHSGRSYWPSSYSFSCTDLPKPSSGTPGPIRLGWRAGISKPIIAKDGVRRGRMRPKGPETGILSVSCCRTVLRESANRGSAAVKAQVGALNLEEAYAQAKLSA